MAEQAAAHRSPGKEQEDPAPSSGPEAIASVCPPPVQTVVLESGAKLGKNGEKEDIYAYVCLHIMVTVFSSLLLQVEIICIHYSSL